MEQVKVSPRVNVRIEKIRSDHVRTEAYHNLAVDSGLNLIRDFLYGDAVSGLERFALGTGTGQVQAADAKLENEVFRDQLTKVTKTDKGLEIKYYLSSTDANGYAISEAGLFANGATDMPDSGTLYARVTFPAEEKMGAEAWNFTWTLEWDVV